MAKGETSGKPPRSTPRRARATKLAKAAPPLASADIPAGDEGAAVAPGVTAPAPLALFTLAFGSAGLVMQAVAAAGIHRRRTALEDFFREIGRQISAGGSPDEVRAKLHWRIRNEPSTGETIFSAVQRLLDATCSEAALPLAHLASEYLGRTPDAFFRGFAALLSEVTSEELLDLRALLQNLMGLRPQAVGPDLAIMPPDAAHPAEPLSVFLGAASEEPRHRAVPAPSTRRRLFRLLKTYDLAFEPSVGGTLSGARSGPDALALEWAMVERLFKYVG